MFIPHTTGHPKTSKIVSRRQGENFNVARQSCYHVVAPAAIAMMLVATETTDERRANDPRPTVVSRQDILINSKVLARLFLKHAPPHTNCPPRSSQKPKSCLTLRLPCSTTPTAVVAVSEEGEGARQAYGHPSASGSGTRITNRTASLNNVITFGKQGRSSTNDGRRRTIYST
jgi:hypothetical protein